MVAPVALQLYSVREYAKDDFEGTVRRVADMGYAGVEPAGFPGTTPEAAGRLFRQLELDVPSAHVPLPVGDRANEVLETMAAIGCSRIVSGKGPDDFSSLDKIKETCDLFNEAHAVAKAAGLTFGIHNHWWEYTPVEGTYPYKVMLERLDPEILFQIDTYWVQTAGLDAAEVVREIGTRAPLLHIKDGPCEKGVPMTAVGSGKMDVPAVVAAGGDTTAWLIVEIDRCDGDMMACVEKSYTYLVTEGLGRGRV